MNIQEITATVDALYQKLPKTQVKKLRNIVRKEEWTESNKEAVIDNLSQLLLIRKHTQITAKCFSPILLELLAHCECQLSEEEVDLDLHERICVAIGELVGRFPDVSRFCGQYFECNKSVFARLEDVNSEPPKKKRKRRKSNQGLVRWSPLLKAALQLLSFDVQFFTRIWNWSSLIHFLDGSNQPYVRWLACHCLAFLTEMPKEKLGSLLETQLSPVLLQEQNFQNYHLLQTLYPAQVHSLPSVDRTGEATLHKDDCHLCPNVTSVAGVLLLKNNEESPTNQILVEVPSVRQTLRDVAMSVAIGQPVLLEGPVGCGKTTIVEHLAAITNREPHVDLFKIQLGDQTDSKILVGSYCCTDIPGEFVWRAGPLT